MNKIYRKKSNQNTHMRTRTHIVDFYQTLLNRNVTQKKTHGNCEENKTYVLMARGRQVQI